MRLTPPTDLPIEAAVPTLILALADIGAAVLVAAPGAGKSTVVPLRLLGSAWLKGRILMLEPRRVAAKAIAARLAANLGERVGKTVGHRVRHDTQVSDATMIEVVTEGVLTRMLVNDPSLDGYGAVIFDEFHERNLTADLGLALVLASRESIRPDLRILVMSATIDGQAVANLLGDVPVIDAPGRVFPVDTRYRPNQRGLRLDGHVASVVREALVEETGDVLVFLPGVGDIKRVAELLRPDLGGVVIAELHGSLSLNEQTAALAPGQGRRVVLATDIAETSLTVPGVRIVIDAGLAKSPRFSPRTGLTHLETLRVSRSAADQRRGRAGRTEPGVCYRLWSLGEEAGLLAFAPPEITATDLAPLALDLAAAGFGDPHQLRWLDPPPAAALAQAEGLLRQLGALDQAGRLTAIGREMAALGLHPRVAHLAVLASRRGQGALAAVLAALLGERDIVRRSRDIDLPDVDLRSRVEAVLGQGGTLSIERFVLERVRAEVTAWRRALRVPKDQVADPERTGELLSWAYPDRIAQRRPGQVGRFLLRNGRGASIPAQQPLARADYLVAAELDDAGADGRIMLAAPIDAEVVATLEGTTETIVDWDLARHQLVAVEQTKLGAIVLSEKALAAPPRSAVRLAVRQAIDREGIGALAWTDVASDLRARLAFLHQLDQSWPDVGDRALLDRVDHWLDAAVPAAGPVNLDPAELLIGGLPWDRRRDLDRLAPPRYRVPTGSELAIDYTDPAQPVLAVKLQEMFGETTTPTIGGGRMPLLLHLLSPAGRPLQVTRDLAGFWRTSYHDVRREMKGRYPKHEWPEDPANSAPTRRTKRRD